MEVSALGLVSGRALRWPCDLEGQQHLVPTQASTVSLLSDEEFDESSGCSWGYPLSPVFLPVVHAFDLNTVASRSIPLYGPHPLLPSPLSVDLLVASVLWCCKQCRHDFGTCVSF